MTEIFDGATGTMLQASGLKPGECPELINTERPEMIEKIHRAYIEAGSSVITTNTFGGTSLKLAHYGLESKVAEINAAAVKAAKRAAEGRAKVAGDMGPTGKFIEPLGDLGFETAFNAYLEQAKALADAGADYIIIETFIDLQEMRAALLAAKEATNIPVICQMSYSEDGRTVTGTDPETAATVLDALGADVIGVNCSLGPEELVPVVKKLAESTEKPIIVQPNAGLPKFIEGKTVFPMTPEDFAYWTPKLIEAGASFVGGCCGTTPDHIRAVAQAAKITPEPSRVFVPRGLRLSGRTKTVVIDKKLPTVLIGERINPTGRKKLAGEIKEGSLISVKKEAIDQTRAGAEILDVNMGVGGIDEAAAMKRAVTEIAQITSAPLAIDTGNAEALEAGLRIYPGRALINSVSAEPERLKKFLPLAKKYGAAILCLPITKDGVPKTAEQRLEAVSIIIEEAKKAGLKDEDFLLDALVLTVAAEKDAARETLSTLRLYRERFGYPTTMGLSNISFGLPNRPLINSAFFAMCLAEGLDAPIMNPYDESMKNVLAASEALLGKDPNGRNFSKNAADFSSPKAPTALKEDEKDTLSSIKAAVINGEKERMASLIEKAVDEKIDPNEITEKALTAAMNEIGEDFGAGKVFLPQVLLSAESMREAFGRLKNLLPATESKTLGTVVIATVKGDVHDLGKNIVSALLQNSGFKVVDLGKDVPSEMIVKAAKVNRADIVGLCALMTTTMTEIENVVEALRCGGVKSKVMAGGAAVTPEYAKEAGADIYAPDGVAAVRLAKEALNEKI